jgi:uncharacterized protein YjbI with pentapeptide repeats
MANPEHLKLLQQGADGWNAWRAKESWAHEDLSDADLKGANLQGANLEGATLKGANLLRADLRGGGPPHGEP